MNGEVQEHLENTSRFVASSCGTPSALRQEQRTRGIAAGSRPVTAPGRAAHQSPWQESVPRLPEPGNDRRNFFHAESGSAGAAALAALPPRRASGAGAAPAAFLFACACPRQGNGAPEPGTAGVKPLGCQCCQSHTGDAREMSCWLQPVHQERPLPARSSPSTALQQENGIRCA